MPWILERVRLAESEAYLQRQTEIRAADQALLTFMGVKLPWWEPKPEPAPVPIQAQPIGQACGSKLIPLCQPFYREQLPIACRTCPGPKKK